jgi:hypothetical protein
MNAPGDTVGTAILCFPSLALSRSGSEGISHPRVLSRAGPLAFAARLTGSGAIISAKGSEIASFLCRRLSGRSAASLVALLVRHTFGGFPAVRQPAWWPCL